MLMPGACMQNLNVEARNILQSLLTMQVVLSRCTYSSIAQKCIACLKTTMNGSDNAKEFKHLQTTCESKCGMEFDSSIKHPAPSKMVSQNV
ncbi:Hypothetical protein PHPALM_13983 [Phytophthora palmivora]|uniref:Uncharacterized protein n=1 Tax=Phytophthora palmivora TaxID=4796 RepID=A0A2P4XW73_9STRA|nr:Hypothetical protein PHPALM_13983 [Phytophthora palmivora]